MTPRPRFLPAYAMVAFLALAVGACSPSLSPLYRDYEIHYEAQAVDRPIAERIRDAIVEAGWQPTPSSALNAVATETRTVRRWGLYAVIVSLEAVPVGPDHVRVYFHPYRKYFTGNRSKIPFLRKDLQRTLLRDLNDAFEKQGLVAVGTGIERDRRAAAR